MSDNWSEHADPIVLRDRVIKQILEIDRLNATIARLKAELTDLRNKQRIDQNQCDEATSEAGKMAQENHRLHRHIVKQDAEIAALQERIRELLGFREEYQHHVAAITKEREELKMSKCSGEHQHAWGKDGHAHGHGTMWFEGNPNEPHHHHDLTCLHAKDAEIARLEARVKELEGELAESKIADYIIQINGLTRQLEEANQKNEGLERKLKALAYATNRDVEQILKGE